jgi:spermidine synthase
MHLSTERLPGPSHRTLNLFLVSVVGLFIELMLIRWIATEFRIFAYLQNTVLVVCFLGLGMGCWTCRHPIQIRKALQTLLALIALLSIPFIRQRIAADTEKLSLIHLIWGYEVTTDDWLRYVSLFLGLLQTFVLMLLIWNTFVPLGRLIGRLLDDHPRPIWAYSINIAGSLIGILLYAVLCAANLNPLVWCLVTAALLLPFLEPPAWKSSLLLAGLVGLSSLAVLYPDTRTSRPQGVTEAIVGCWWSPYQKLMLVRESKILPQGERVIHTLYVNNSPYMTLLDLRVSETERFPELFDPKFRGLSQYDLPMRFQPAPKKMLIVGSGGGNDVAGGLRGGAESITAVEIDPTIIEIGRRFHPEQPYSSPKVTIVNDDARAFFANTTDRFDLIVFGLLDSHTTTAMTNARLDHYVYTRESLTQAKKLLRPGGVIVLSFEAQKPFIADRMARVLREVFDQEPITFRVPLSDYGYGGQMFIVGDLPQVRHRITADPALAGAIAKWQERSPLKLSGETIVATDDWPYIYLEINRVPPLYWLLGLTLLVLFQLANLLLGTRDLLSNWQMRHLHFFFLGAAFMLLEVQNISKAAVVLGNTWDVNAVIIASIMVIILLANLLAALWPNLPLIFIYAGLIGSTVGLYFVDLAWFAGLPYLGRAVVVGLLTSLPMLFSGVVFIRSFAITVGKDSALGANLFGALVGGLLQSVTFVTGIKALLLIVAGLYTAAWLTKPRT